MSENPHFRANIEYEPVINQDPIVSVNNITYEIREGQGYVHVGGEQELLTLEEFLVFDYLTSSVEDELEKNPESNRSQPISIDEIAEGCELLPQEVMTSFYSLKQKIEKNLPRSMVCAIRDRSKNTLQLTEPISIVELLKGETKREEFAGITLGIEEGKAYVVSGTQLSSLLSGEFVLFDSLISSLKEEKVKNPDARKSRRIPVQELVVDFNSTHQGIINKFYTLRKKVEKDLPENMHRLIFCRDEESLLMTEQPYSEDLIREDSIKSIAGLTYGRREDGRPVLIREDTLVTLDPELYKMLEILGDRFDAEPPYNTPISYEEMAGLLNVRVENMKQLSSKLRKILSEGLEPNYHRLIKTPAGLILVDPPIENYAKPGPVGKEED